MANNRKVEVARSINILPGEEGIRQLEALFFGGATFDELREANPGPTLVIEETEPPEGWASVDTAPGEE